MGLRCGVQMLSMMTFRIGRNREASQWLQLCWCACCWCAFAGAGKEEEVVVQAEIINSVDTAHLNKVGGAGCLIACCGLLGGTEDADCCSPSY